MVLGLGWLLTYSLLSISPLSLNIHPRMAQLRIFIHFFFDSIFDWRLVSIYFLLPKRRKVKNLDLAGSEPSPLALAAAAQSMPPKQPWGRSKIPTKIGLGKVAYIISISKTCWDRGFCPQLSRQELGKIKIFGSNILRGAEQSPSYLQFLAKNWIRLRSIRSYSTRG